MTTAHITAEPPLAIPMMTIEDVAHLLNVCQPQVRRWIVAGKFPHAVRLPGRGHWRVPVADYESFLRIHQRSSATDSATASGG